MQRNSAFGTPQSMVELRLFLLFYLIPLCTAEKEKSENEKSIVIKGLGRPFRLGALYSRVTDTIVPGSLWNYRKVMERVTTREDRRSMLKTIQSAAIWEKMDILDVDVQLKASFLGGKVTVSGAAEYIDEKSGTNLASFFALKYRSNTHWESLNMDHLRDLDYEDELDKTDATHVVYQIVYGVETVFEFRRQFKNKKDMKTIGGKLELKANLISEEGGGEDVLDISAEADARLNKTDYTEFSDLKVSYYGDIRLKRNPTKFEDAMKTYRRMPKLIKKDRAVPVDVYLYPLSSLGDRAVRLAKQVGVAALKSAAEVTKNIENMQNELLDLLNYKPIVSKLDRLGHPVNKALQQISIYDKQYRKELMEYIPKIRSGEYDDSAINWLLNVVTQGPFDIRTLKQWVVYRQREASVLQTYLAGLGNVGIGRMMYDTHLADLTKVFVLAQRISIGSSKDKLMKIMKNYTNSYWQGGEITIKVEPLETVYNIPTLRASFHQFKKLYDSNQDPDSTVSFVVYDVAGTPGEMNVSSELYENAVAQAEIKLPTKTDYKMFVTADYAATLVTIPNREDWQLIQGFRMKTNRPGVTQRHKSDVNFVNDGNGENPGGEPNIAIMNHTEYPLNQSLPERDQVTVTVKPQLHFGFGYEESRIFRVPKKSIHLTRKRKPWQELGVKCTFEGHAFTVAQAPEPDFCLHLCRTVQGCQAWVSRLPMGGEFYPCSIYNSTNLVETTSEDEAIYTPYFGGKKTAGKVKVNGTTECVKAFVAIMKKVQESWMRLVKFEGHEFKIESHEGKKKPNVTKTDVADVDWKHFKGIED